MVDRSSLRLSATLVVIGEVLFAIVTLFHPDGDANNHPVVFAKYASDASYETLHVVQFVFMAFLLLGLFVLSFALNVRSGALGWMDRFAAVSAVVALALYGGIQAVDGVALKHAVDAWVNAPEAQKATRFASAETVRWLEWGMNSYQLFMFALALILLASVIVGTARVPRAIGYLMGLAAVPMLVQSQVIGTSGFSVPLLAGSLSAVVLPLMLVWSIWLLIYSWRMKEPDQPGQWPTLAGPSIHKSALSIHPASGRRLAGPQPKAPRPAPEPPAGRPSGVPPRRGSRRSSRARRRAPGRTRRTPMPWPPVRAPRPPPPRAVRPTSRGPTPRAVGRAARPCAEDDGHDGDMRDAYRRVSWGRCVPVSGGSVGHRTGAMRTSENSYSSTTVVNSVVVWHHVLSGKKEDVVSQAVDRKTVSSWTEELEAVNQRLSAHFVRSEARERTRDYLRGLLSGAERKNGWQLAEIAGNATPYGIQHLLGRANWDADAVRDQLRSYVLEHLAGEEGVLIVDETGFIKKGDKSVGVKRQYTGTAGKTENCQVGVFLAYASERGRAFVDRELYLPEEWAKDAGLRERAAVPEEIGMRTKPELAKEMLGRALDGGAKAAWVLADSVYGDTRRLGMFLEEREQPYVLALSGKAYVWAGWRQHRVGEVLEILGEGGLVPEEDFRRISVADGSKGPRLYEWARLPLNPPMQDGFERWLLMRRSIEEPAELTAYTVFAPEGAALEELAKAAGTRWQVEIGLEEAKGEVGLSHYEVRSWHGWYRHITLALFAHALLAALRSAGLDVRGRTEKGGPKRSASLSEFRRKRGLSCS